MNPLKLLWSFYGRIGRLAYLGGLLLNLAWALAVLVALVYLDQGRTPGQPPHPAVVPVLIPGFVLFIWSKFALAAKRFQDLGDSGWLSLLLIVPLISVFAFVYLLVVRGQDHDNAYGPARRAAVGLEPARS
jgi:uncharacterized membrane protein YhaH (DUF805 family)